MKWIPKTLLVFLASFSCVAIHGQSPREKLALPSSSVGNIRSAKEQADQQRIFHFDMESMTIGEVKGRQSESDTRISDLLTNTNLRFKQLDDKPTKVESDVGTLQGYVNKVLGAVAICTSLLCIPYIRRQAWTLLKRSVQEP